jgi:hypothetical protein
MRPGTHAKLLQRKGSPLLRLFVLVAFFLQSFLVQTHVHNLMLPASSVAGTAVSAAHDGKAPLDADRCLLCQEYTHSGAYVTPAVAAALPPMLAIGVVVLKAAPALASKPISHNWMGRAPPRA